MNRLVATGALAAVAALLLASAGGTRAIKEGGTFRISQTAGFLDAIDPAIYNPQGSVQLLRPACSSLLSNPNERPPAGLRYEPDLAADYPVVSRNGRKYTFTIRQDARFSTGAPVLARDVVHSLERVLTPALRSRVGSRSRRPRRRTGHPRREGNETVGSGCEGPNVDSQVA